MPCRARQAAARRPAAVAIHDDGDMQGIAPVIVRGIVGLAHGLFLSEYFASQSK
jgi:hypothetical protein